MAESLRPVDRWGNLLVPLSHRERQLLYDVLEIQIEGMQAAKQHTEEDPTFTNVDDFVSSMGQYDMDIETLEGIRKKVQVQ